jgi:hypothetical protein
MKGFRRAVMAALALAFGLLPRAAVADNPSPVPFSAFTSANMTGAQVTAGAPCTLPINGVPTRATCGLSFTLRGDSSESTAPSQVNISVNYSDPIVLGGQSRLRGGLWTETTTGGQELAGEVLGALDWPSPTFDGGCGLGVGRISFGLGEIPFSVERQVLNACWNWSPNTAHARVSGAIVVVPYVKLASTVDGTGTNQFTTETAVVPVQYTAPGASIPPNWSFSLDTALVPSSISIAVTGLFSRDGGATWLNFAATTIHGGIFIDGKSGISPRLPEFGGGIPQSSIPELVRLNMTSSAPIAPPAVEASIEAFS